MMMNDQNQKPWWANFSHHPPQDPPKPPPPEEPEGGPERLDPYKDTKVAYMWVYAQHPWCIGYPGVVGDLFFSSPEKFRECLERDPDEGDYLVKVTVPKDFDDWDYIPENY